MSCNCGCHPPDNKTPATGWRKFLPLIVGVVVVGALIAGAVLKQNGTAASRSPTERAATAVKP
jgi:hypothetical protein